MGPHHEHTPFVLPGEYADFAANVRAFSRDKLYDGYLDRATSQTMPWEELRLLGRAGLLGMSLPVESGGQGADPLVVGLALEELAYADVNVAYLSFSSETVTPAHRGLPPAIGEPLAHSVAQGEEVLAMALTEPGAGSDNSAMRLHARPVSGGYLLRGEKTSITGAVHSRRGVVAATTEPGGGSQAVRRLLVDLTDSSVTVQRIKDPGFHPVGRATITFEDTFVPADHELREEMSGLAGQLSLLDYTRAMVGLMCVGAAKRAIDMTVGWVRDRHAFGKSIAGYQGVSFTLAEHATQLEAARMLTYRALALIAAGQSARREAAMTKWWTPRVAMAAINDCIVLHGHVGWSSEMPLQQLLVDVSGMQIGDGTPQIQKLVIARDLIGRAYVG
ncbi:MAG: acyl-CoA dehydrogenase [Gordonia sp. (in: high G+C Gram-positive bacteria)]|nr:MAG: acyl-CoA dehydrogenase [Gordonia sp. (in: high G+C Gram-positive bacteria)]